MAYHACLVASRMSAQALAEEWLLSLVHGAGLSCCPALHLICPSTSLLEYVSCTPAAEGTVRTKRTSVRGDLCKGVWVASEVPGGPKADVR